jgi:hypothetical protein
MAALDAATPLWIGDHLLKGTEKNNFHFSQIKGHNQLKQKFIKSILSLIVEFVFFHYSFYSVKLAFFLPIDDG